MGSHSATDHLYWPHCSHLQANLYRSSTFNVPTIWDPIVCTMIYMIQTTVKKHIQPLWIKYVIIWFRSHLSFGIKVKEDQLLYKHICKVRVDLWCSYNSCTVMLRKWTDINIQKILQRNSSDIRVTQCTRMYFLFSKLSGALSPYGHFLAIYTVWSTYSILERGLEL